MECLVGWSSVVCIHCHHILAYLRTKRLRRASQINAHSFSLSIISVKFHIFDFVSRSTVPIEVSYFIERKREKFCGNAKIYKEDSFTLWYYLINWLCVCISCRHDPKSIWHIHCFYCCVCRFNPSPRGVICFWHSLKTIMCCCCCCTWMISYHCDSFLLWYLGEKEFPPLKWLNDQHEKKLKGIFLKNAKRQ